MDLLRDTLLAASQPYARGGGQSSTAAPSKGVGGSWSTLSEASTLPGFESELRRLVTELYPRAPHQRSGLDQVLQRLLADKPQLAGAVVAPVLAALQRQADTSVAAGSSSVGGLGGGAGGGGGGWGVADAVDGSAGGKKRKKGKKGKAIAATQHVAVAASGGGGRGAITAAVVAEALDAEAAEDGLAGDGAAHADVHMAAAADDDAGEPQHGAGGAGAAGPDKPPPQLPPPSAAGAALLKYDTRVLPVAWLLQCFGPVAPPLRCLWPGQRQLRAAILEATAVFFEESQRKGAFPGADTSAAAAQQHATPRHAQQQQQQQQQQRRRSRPQGGCSVVVRFARDCLAATPAHLRLQLLEDAVALSRRRWRPRHKADVAVTAHTQPPQQAQTRSCVEEEEAEEEEEEEEEGGGFAASPPPRKRRRLGAATALGRTENGGPAAAAAATEAAAAAEEAASQPLQLASQPCPRCGCASPHTAAAGGGEPQAVAEAAEAEAPPRRLPWAALLAAVCEDEAMEAQAQGGAPRGSSVLSPLALTELLLARGDLFCPACDVVAAAPTMLRCLASLAPDQTAGLLRRVLAASRPSCSSMWRSNITSTYSSSSSSSSSRSGCAGLQLVAALEVLRRPPRDGRSVVDASAGHAGAAGTGGAEDSGGGATGGRKRGARLQPGTAAAAATAQSHTAEGAVGSSQEPEPLSALWLLAHVLPPLLEPLSRCRDSAPAPAPAVAATTDAGAVAPGAAAGPVGGRWRGRGDDGVVAVVAVAGGGGAAQVAAGEEGAAADDDEADRDGDGADAAAGAVWDGEAAHDARCLGALRALLARPALLLPDGTYEGGGGRCGGGGEQHGGGGGAGGAASSVGGGTAFDLAVEAAAAQLPVASQVFALHVRKNVRSAAAQRLLAALLLDAFGAGGSTGGGNSSALQVFGTAELDPGPGLRLAEALSRSCSPATGGATSRAGAAQQQQEVWDLVAAAWAERDKLTQPLWPRLRPLLAVLEPLSSSSSSSSSSVPGASAAAGQSQPQLCDHPVAAAVRALLLMALVPADADQMAPRVDEPAAPTQAADVAAVAGGLVDLLGSAGGSGSSSSGGGGGGDSGRGTGAAAARAAAAALGGRHGALSAALLSSWRARLDVARVLVLAAGLEQPMGVKESEEAAPEPAAAAAGAEAAAAVPHRRPLARALMERLAAAVAAVAAALPPEEASAAVNGTGSSAAAASTRGAKGRLPAATTAATAAALSKLQSEVELVRLLAAVLAAVAPAAAAAGEARLSATGVMQSTASATSQVDPVADSSSAMAAGAPAPVPLLAAAAAGSLAALLLQQCRQPASSLASALRRFASNAPAVDAAAKEGVLSRTGAGYGRGTFGAAVAGQQGQVQAVVEALGILADVGASK
ncbi:hypothetical protein HYH02_003660 [Chlamydomonas schloesseri]|uniref:Uncharacterized protein n=1 Tax=Chlamydomonas schloesseri TaxID=2026947 RepID=A0A835WQL5_9CHLO|nr:hypothetical protein HYH02_003660 [Chlamydomonas schloesseri]|eukprot:KAG2451885.1 hypothetical protein HYH02_003660 [Chlamydomonas schloesseri]